MSNNGFLYGSFENPRRLFVLASLFLMPLVARSAETKLIDSAGNPAWLYASTDSPDPGKTYWLAVGIHGEGGNCKDAGGIANWAGDEVIVLGPSFGQTAQQDGPAQIANLKALIGTIRKTWRLHPKVFIHGFSTGARFAQQVAMLEPDLVGGVSAVAADAWPTRGFGDINPAARGIPFAISCGQYDRKKASPELPLSRIDWMKEFAAKLEEANFDVEARVIEGVGHEQKEDALALAKSCFARTRGLNFSRTAMLALDFNGSDPLWDLAAQTRQPGTSRSVTAIARWDAVGGAIEQPGTAVRSGAFRLSVNSNPVTPEWSGSLHTGLLPVRCPEADLKKLTLSFDLSASAARPVEVTIESFAADKKRTGGLSGLIHPAASGFHHRHVLDLGSMVATGAFNAEDPLVNITFRIGSDLGWSAAPGHQVQVDNLSYAAPALYVSAAGKDNADHGTSAEKPLATVQKAVDRARAGDVIMVMDGTYETKSSVAQIQAAGAPAAWLVLRSHPGHRPVFRTVAWDCIKIGQSKTAEISQVPSPAYIELRGLTIHGGSAEVEMKYKDKIGKPEPETNSNGISLDGRFQKNKPHHIRIADCTVFECPGGGISAIHTDRVSIENNVTRDNCHWMIYAGSGISVYQTFNFENSPGEYRVLVRNNISHDNYCTQPWVVTGKTSDGNGLIVDDLRNTQNQSPNGIYQGRVLLQGNVSYRNGGSGMHAFSSDRVDFIHNTAVGNNIREDYTQIGVTRCTDCRILNNIMVAPADRAINRVNGNASGILISHNLLWGGNGSSVPGGHSLAAEPQFVDPEAGDFRLRSDSPALKQGGSWEMLPSAYQNGMLRPSDAPPDVGALPAVR